MVLTQRAMSSCNRIDASYHFLRYFRRACPPYNREWLQSFDDLWRELLVGSSLLLYPAITPSFLLWISLHSRSNSMQPSAYKFEVNNGDSAWWGCGTIGGITTASAVEDLITLAGATTSTSAIETSHTSLGVESPSAAISSASVTSAPSAETTISVSSSKTAIPVHLQRRHQPPQKPTTPQVSVQRQKLVPWLVQLLAP